MACLLGFFVVVMLLLKKAASNVLGTNWSDLPEDVFATVSSQCPREWTCFTVTTVAAVVHLHIELLEMMYFIIEILLRPVGYIRSKAYDRFCFFYTAPNGFGECVGQ